MLPKKNRILRGIHKAYHHYKALAFLKKGESAKAEDYYRCYGSSNKDILTILDIFEHNLKNGIKDAYRHVFLEKLIEYNVYGLGREAFHRFIKSDDVIASVLYKSLYTRLGGEKVQLEDFRQALIYQRYQLADVMLGRYEGDYEALSELIASVPPENRASQDFQYLEVNVARWLEDQIADYREYMQGR